MRIFNKKIIKHGFSNKGWWLRYDSERVKANRLRLNASDGSGWSNSIYIDPSQIRPLMKALFKMQRDLKKAGVL